VLRSVWVFIAYRDKKLSGVFVRFSCAFTRPRATKTIKSASSLAGDLRLGWSQADMFLERQDSLVGPSVLDSCIDDTVMHLV
jgi:hypothetical protein